jgi:hypothetical protein
VGGPSGAEQAQSQQLTSAQIANMNASTAQSQQLFGETNPGLTMAESYYQSLASGNQSKIFSAIAPAVSQINSASQGAVQNIRNNTPRGGVEQLAEANVQQQRAGQIGQLATSAYTGAAPALASLSGQGIGLSINEMANATSAGSAASSNLNALMQNQAQGKGTTMGFLGSLAGAGGELGSAAILA